MLILSINIHGLGVQVNKLSLKCLVEVNKPEVVFIQETMGKGDTLVKNIKISFVG
jgi:hypothetical protein